MTPLTHTHILWESHTRPGLTHDLLWMSKPHRNLVERSGIVEEFQCITSIQEMQALRSNLAPAGRKTIQCLGALRSSAIFNCKCQRMLRVIALIKAPFHKGSCTLSLSLVVLSHFPQIVSLAFNVLFFKTICYFLGWQNTFSFAS